MAVPVIQQVRVGAYIMGKKLRGVEKYPLVLMLEPLFRCNLACPGCGKIDYEDDILNKRLSVDECLKAVDDCGAPIVSIPGGEPLIHKEIKEIVEGIVARKKFVYLCTNALLLEKNLSKFTPTPYLTFSVHLDGMEAHHDKAVNQPGTFKRAVSAIRKGITVSPGYAYERAPDQEHFLSRKKTKQLFRDVFKHEGAEKWRFSQSTLFLDFLAGNQSYKCTPWGNPTRNIFGWQKPCYLLNEGYADTFQELMDSVEWDKYGTGNYEKCADCMVHCGYEPTAVTDTVSHPLKALKVFLKGINTDGEMAPEINMDNQRPAEFVFEGLVKTLSQKMEEKAEAEKQAAARKKEEAA